MNERHHINNKNLVQLALEIEEHLRAIRRILRRPLETEIAQAGLTGPQLSILRTLADSDRLTLTELSKKVGLTHSTVSGIVDRLEARKILQRESHESDARFTRIALSKPVRAYLRDTLPSVTLNPLMKALSSARSKDQATVLDGLRTLRRLLQPDNNTTRTRI